jgi:hypothetical protein
VTPELRSVPEVVRILQEVETAKCQREAYNVLWSHRDFIDQMPDRFRELFYAAVDEATSELSWEHEDVT